MDARIIHHPAALKVNDLIVYEHPEKGIRMYKIYEFGTTDDGFAKVELTCLTESAAGFGCKLKDLQNNPLYLLLVPAKDKLEVTHA